MLWDTATGDTVLFPVRSTIGELSGNTVTYRSCVQGLEVDVVYVNKLAGLSQSLIFRKQPDFSLADLKMNEASTRWLAYSAVDEAPEPERQVNQIGEEGSIESDESLDFGSIKIGKGSAFSIDGAVPGELDVLKTWAAGPDGTRYRQSGYSTLLYAVKPTDPAVFAAVSVTPCARHCGCASSTLNLSVFWNRLKISSRSFDGVSPVTSAKPQAAF